MIQKKTAPLRLALLALAPVALALSPPPPTPTPSPRSADVVLVDRNPQVFMNIFTAKPDDYRKVTHRVYLSKELPSRLEVNVLR